MCPSKDVLSEIWGEVMQKMRESMKREIAFGPYEQGIASGSKNVLSSWSDSAI